MTTGCTLAASQAFMLTLRLIEQFYEGVHAGFALARSLIA